MHQDLKNFLAKYLRVVLLSFLPVVITSFLSIPYVLGGHPGEPLVRSGPSDLHMT